MQQKQKMMIAAAVGIVLVILAGVGIYAFTQRKSETTEAPKVAEKKKKISQFNVIPVSERPYVEITPTAGGRNILLTIAELKKPAENVEYELEYQAGELLQGAFGEISLVTLPATKDILLGSCSAGGACTYHKEVQGGSLVTRFSGSNEYALKSDWRYIENTKKEKTAASKDAKFQIESAELAKQPVLIIANSPGYPGTLPGTPISDVYGLATPGTLTGKVDVTIRANEDATGAKLALWDGSAWTTVAATVDEKTVTAATEFAKAYVVVKE